MVKCFCWIWLTLLFQGSTKSSEIFVPWHQRSLPQLKMQIQCYRKLVNQTAVLNGLHTILGGWLLLQPEMHHCLQHKLTWKTACTLTRPQVQCPHTLQAQETLLAANQWKRRLFVELCTLPNIFQWTFFALTGLLSSDISSGQCPKLWQSEKCCKIPSNLNRRCSQISSQSLRVACHRSSCLFHWLVKKEIFSKKKEQGQLLIFWHLCSRASWWDFYTTLEFCWLQRVVHILNLSDRQHSLLCMQMQQCPEFSTNLI